MNKTVINDNDCKNTMICIKYPRHKYNQELDIIKINTVIACLTKSMKIFKDNAISFVVAVFIASIISIFIVTIPPTLYSLIYMAVKASRGEKVRIDDVFFAFRSKEHFIRCWIFSILIYIPPIVISGICGIITYVQTGTFSDGLLMATILFAVSLFIIRIIIPYAESIFVMNCDLGVIDALKKNMTIYRYNVFETITSIVIALILSSIGSLYYGILSLVTMPISMIFFVLMVEALDLEIPESREEDLT